MIHREGRIISIIVIVVLMALNTLAYYTIGVGPAFWVLNMVSVLFMVFILRFFRDPKRRAYFSPGIIYSPADGKVVVVEETEEKEYLDEKRIQLSIFMSVWNVHINWYPVEGTLSYYRYHPGKYLVARHPKSSNLNERSSVAIRIGSGKELLVRQIAGAVARRIISYASVDKKVSAGEEMGFIRFGSRVDLFLPLDSKILVKPGQKVRGLQTPIAELEK